MIRRRSPENRMAYLEGFEAAVALAEKYGTEFAREFLRLHAESEARLQTQQSPASVPGDGERRGSDG